MNVTSCDQIPWSKAGGVGNHPLFPHDHQRWWGVTIPRAGGLGGEMGLPLLGHPARSVGRALNRISPMSSSTQPMKVVLVDHHEMVLLGLTEMLRPYSMDVEIVGMARSVVGARSKIATMLPDIVLADVCIGHNCGVDFVRSLATSHPLTKVIMLTAHEDEHFLFQSLRAGAKGYLLKCVDGHELVAHLRRVQQGDVVVDPSLAGRVALSAAQTWGRDYWPGARRGITHRESEVLDLLVSGNSNRDIATRLVISEDTVKTHTRSLYRKLNVRDRTAATAMALREGLSH